ncbi:hypothetical protein [Tsuneonella mangrovi]|uniref:hypothetical protein n=1 Tax=Tsuneonella mangrovi TaxID=1982042 RepID=UPI001F0AA381|nr:hypothetical protein [Tsuneonella mangrovi]
MSQSTTIPIESVLRDELAHGDVVLGTIEPILGHLLANHDHSLFSDEIVSRVRGMIMALARQLVLAQAEFGKLPDPHGFAEKNTQQLAKRLMADGGITSHCHALALEFQLTTRLERRNAIDPVLSPLLQALVSSDEDQVATTAMAALTAQARFVQRQHRMELPLTELPSDLFHNALECLLAASEEHHREAAADAQIQLRQSYNESASRLGLIERLVNEMGNGIRAALSVGHSGVAIFLSALSASVKQARDLTIVATNDRQLARLSIALRAAGLKPKEVEQQFLYFHPDIALPEGFDTLRTDRAVALLAESGRSTVV